MKQATDLFTINATTISDLRAHDKTHMQRTYNGYRFSHPMQVAADGNVVVDGHGRLCVYCAGANDPDWRVRTSRLFGVRTALASEFAGELRCRITGRVIPVSSIEDNPILWADYEHKVVLPRLPGYAITYQDCNAAPQQLSQRVSEHEMDAPVVAYSFSNTKAATELRTKVAGFLRQAEAFRALTPYVPYYHTPRAPDNCRVTKHVLAAIKAAPEGAGIPDVWPSLFVDPASDTVLSHRDTLIATILQIVGNDIQLAARDHYEAESLELCV